MNSYKNKYPDNFGKFGKFGGKFVPEILMPALEELEKAFFSIKDTPAFQKELRDLLKDYAGRPTPLYLAKNLSEKLGCKVYLKREDLLHGGAHKINNTLGQALLCKYMKKTRLIAETGAGQHGFATAIAGALMGIKTEVHMGREDVERQKFNVFRMKLLGANIRPVDSGSKTLKDAINEALRDWITNLSSTYYLIGSVVGPHPYPLIVREFQKIIGIEIREQILQKENRLPNAIIACVGGGSNAIGAFYEFIEDENVELHAVEAAGKGINTADNAISLGKDSKGVFHGAHTHLQQDRYGQIKTSYSVSAGLDYPGVGPEHALLKEIKRLKTGSATDQEALDAFKMLCKTEGIIPALEPSHALGYLIKIAKKAFNRDDIVVLNLSGAGGKDLDIINKNLGDIKI
ncbi:MAG: tryptophan synthase subunit beta [Candidatus Lokiarchaeota archaeon]|nr:tryptophan synthase subunit beta [Candidatus Lokiarchaeota archaeon]